MDPSLQAFLINTALPAIAAFAVAHFHILLPAKPANTAPQPATPVSPPVTPTPGQPGQPKTIRPIGQGGLIDIAAELLANILASPASQQNKIAAGTKIFEASQLISAQQ